MSGGLWEVRPLPGGLALELRGGDNPALVIAPKARAASG